MPRLNKEPDNMKGRGDSPAPDPGGAAGQSTEADPVPDGAIGDRLRTLEARYRTLLTLSDDAIWSIDLDRPVDRDLPAEDLARAVLETGRVSDCSPAFMRRFPLLAGGTPQGCRPGQITGFWLHEDLERLEELAEDRFNRTGLNVTEIDLAGRLRHWSVDLVLLEGPDGVVGLSGIERDVTGEHEEDELLREGAELFKAVTRAALDGLLVLDAERQVVDCNEAFARMAGRSVEDLLSGTVSPVAPRSRDAGCPFEAIIRERIWQGDGQLQRADGSSATVELSCYHAGSGSGGFYFFVRDASERKLADRRDREHQEALAHVSRLSTLGEMASGIAHEFNQPLAAIVNYANGCVRLLEQRGVDDQMVFRALRSIVEQGKRASEIIRRLRSFSRRSDDDREAFSLNDLLRDALALTNQPRTKARVTLETDFVSRDDTVVVDGIQIEQVVMNLLLNAVEAIGQGDPESPRWIRVTTRFVNDAGTSSGAHGPESPGGAATFIETAVLDSGPGVSDETAQHLFEPFFSASGKGLGLGLTIGRSIVETHGGRLWLEPRRNEGAGAPRTPQGACFRFTLPLRRGPMGP